MNATSRAVFISYASQDAEAAGRICEALRAAGLEVWFDQSELRGGDAWDRQIRKQIHECALFVPVISATTQGRLEGYFRREWRLAVDRTHDMSERVAFLVPVVIDDTGDAQADVPDAFRAVQWSRLPAGPTPAFVARISQLLSPSKSQAPAHARPSTGSVPSSEPQAAIGAVSRRSRLVSLLVAAVTVTGVGYLAVDKFFLAKRTAASVQASAPVDHPIAPAQVATSEKSIAVLPFIDISEKRDQEYFSDGLSEELIDLLGRVPGLHVPARVSSFYFKGKQSTLADIAKALNVAHVLEGSVRKSGDRLRITAELVHVADDTRVWSETFDRKLDDIFKVQDDIAGAVVKALKISLLTGLGPTAPLTSNSEAYTLYLQAKSVMKGGAQEDFLKALDYYERAVALDPGFAAGWAALGDLRADSYATFRTPSYREVAFSAHAEAARALALDPNLPEAHSALGRIAYLIDLDWSVAQRELSRTLELAPNQPVALRFLSYLGGTLGHDEEQRQYAERAIASDPLDYWNHFAAAFAHLCAGRLADAEMAYRKALSLNDRAGAIHAYLARLLVVRGRPMDALVEVNKEPAEAWRNLTLPIVLDALGRKTETDSALERVTSRYGDQYAYQIALIYAARNDRVSAFKWLDRSYLQHDATPVFLKHDPLLKHLEGDPRYREFMRKMNLPK